MENPQPVATAESEARSTSDLQTALRNAEKHWLWKIVLRSALVFLNLLAIGCLAWLISISYSDAYTNPYIGWFDYFFLPFALTAIILSLIWCSVCILVPLLRRTHRPVHPGCAVSFDLILWLALIVTGLFTVAGVFSVTYFGRGGTIEDPYSYYNSDYDGQYHQLSNGTWVYKITYVSSSYGDGGQYHYNRTTGNYTYSYPKPSDVKRDCGPYFKTCAAQDAAVNELWQQRDARLGTEIVAATVQFIGVCVHFALFVWACVDVHRRNRGGKQREVQDVADRVIRDMETRGLITVNDPALASRMGGGGSQVMAGTPAVGGTQPVGVSQVSGGREMDEIRPVVAGPSSGAR